MTRIITNETCKLYHTPYCDLLNMENCQNCPANGEKSDQESLFDDMALLTTLLPEEGVASLFESEECLLCKGEHKNKRAFYGLLDMGHVEPKRKKRSVIGIKVDCKVGSLIPLQISTCKPCRNRMLMLEYFPILLPLVTGIIALVVLLLPGVSDSLERMGGAIMPFALFAVVVGLSLIATALLKRLLRARYSVLTRLNPFEIPLIARMREKGWFALSTSGNAVRLIFVRKRMRAGVGTGTQEDALCKSEAAE